MIRLMNDTALGSVCNGTDDQGIKCTLSNYNPFARTHGDSGSNANENQITNHEKRRRMLNDDYSYKLGDNGWWQGRIVNLQFCVVLSDLEWNPSSCDDYDDGARFADAEEFITNEAEYIAFGTFDIVADEGVNNFNNYFESKFSGNNTLFPKLLNDVMNQWFRSDDATFDVVAVSIQETFDTFVAEPEDKFKNAALDVTYGLYCFMGFCLVLAILGSIHATIIGADNVRVMGVVYYGIWTWDFVSDVIFAARALEQGYLYQCLASAVFIVIPWILNMRQLFRHQHVWSNDPTIKERVSSWLIDWSIGLVILAGLSGSAFSAVEICNSQVFGIDFFIMGLTQRHLKAFNGSRLYSTIVWENIPQLLIQIWYTFDRNSVDEVAVWAFLSSVVSIFIAVLDVYSSQALVRAMKSAERANRMFKGQPYFLEILGNYDGIADDDHKIMKSEIEDKKKLLMMKPNAIRRVFGEILEIDHRAVELTLCVGIDHGIQFGFTLYTADADKVSRQQRLFKIYNAIVSENCEFVQGVMNVWDLNDKPIISNIETLYNSYDDYEVQEYTRDRTNIEESMLFERNPNVFEFTSIQHYHIITVVTTADEPAALQTMTSLRNNRSFGTADTFQAQQQQKEQPLRPSSIDTNAGAGADNGRDRGSAHSNHIPAAGYRAMVSVTFDETDGNDINNGDVVVEGDESDVVLSIFRENQTPGNEKPKVSELDDLDENQAIVPVVSDDEDGPVNDGDLEADGDKVTKIVDMKQSINNMAKDNFEDETKETQQLKHGYNMSARASVIYSKHNNPAYRRKSLALHAAVVDSQRKHTQLFKQGIVNNTILARGYLPSMNNILRFGQQQRHSANHLPGLNQIDKYDNNNNSKNKNKIKNKNKNNKLKRASAIFGISRALSQKWVHSGGAGVSAGGRRSLVLSATGSNRDSNRDSNQNESENQNRDNNNNHSSNVNDNDDLNVNNVEMQKTVNVDYNVDADSKVGMDNNSNQDKNDETDDIDVDLKQFNFVNKHKKKRESQDISDMLASSWLELEQNGNSNSVASNDIKYDDNSKGKSQHYENHGMNMSVVKEENDSLHTDSEHDDQSYGGDQQVSQRLKSGVNNDATHKNKMYSRRQSSRL